ncbi:keratin-associated protein 13-1-like [Rousettus aegyptiacus]|uniref:keratin-associated protein 13-1-like n=1 Tax=Rousettus aegyptiacus TaxID=9407 RepID=UPI00168CC726|nr:keratin-associated protein 13-1-like [Rousettus aegyptiacus]
MSYNCCSRNFSLPCGSYLGSPGSSCGSSYPSNLVYSTGLCSPNTCQLGSSLYRGCQNSWCKPTSCQASCVVSSYCPRTSCYPLRTSTLFGPCPSTYSVSLGSGSHRGCSLGYGSRSCYSLGCGFSGFGPLGYRICGFPTLGSGSRFCHPTYFGFWNLQPLRYQPVCGSRFYRLTCWMFSTCGIFL